jgi:hypothetical protein
MCTVDIGNAFLESKSDMECVMAFPNGTWELLGLETRLVQIIGALYGLKQSGRLWYQKLVNILISFGFSQSIYDTCIFHYVKGGKRIWVACHVDDLLIISSDLQLRADLIKHSEGSVNKVELFTENINYLGLDLFRDRASKKIHLRQTKFVNQLIKDLIGENGGVSKYPLSKSSFEVSDQDEVLPPIHDVIGKLRYVVDRTRPDLLFPVNLLSRHMAKPTKKVMTELVRLVRYINYTKDYHLTVGSAKPMTLFGMRDAAYVQSGDCKSSLGYAVYLSDDSGAVYSRSTRATTVSLSSTEAEVDALVELTKEIIWYQGFLQSIGIAVEPPTKVFVDNQPTVTLAAVRVR